MIQSDVLVQVYLQQWLNIRNLTYDYLDVLQPPALSLKLPFPESQSLYYQFFCMTGAHESYLKELEYGAWQGFSSSLSTIKTPTPKIIKEHMMHSDETMTTLLEQIDLTVKLKNGKFGYEVVQAMIEHEMHHQGQLINFLYCHAFPIPETWHQKWDLTR